MQGVKAPEDMIAPSGGMLAASINGLQPTYNTVHAQGRLMRYITYKGFYNGEQWDTRPAPGEVRHTLNYARVFVNKAASYLFGEAVGYDATPVGTVRKGGRKEDRAREVERWLEDVAAWNDLLSLDLATAVAAGSMGDGAWTVRWDEEEGLPRVTGVDPAMLDVRWRADDLRTLLWVRQTYYVSAAELTAEQAGKLGVVTDPYSAMQAQESWTAERWELWVNGVMVDGGLNPYGEIPYIIFPNLRLPHEFWGESDLVDLMDLNRELNLRVSVFGRLLDVAGNPVTVITGASDEETRTLTLGPGRLWTLPESAKAEVLRLLEAGGGAAHVQYIDLLYRALHDISEMPRTSFGDSTSGTMARSGVALEIELQPLLHKLARKRGILGSALVRRAQLMMRIARLHGEKLGEVNIAIQWPPALPQDRLALIQQETLLVSKGIHPVTKSMQVLGDADPEEQLRLVLEQAVQLQVAGINLSGGSSSAPPVAAGQGQAAGATDGQGSAKAEPVLGGK